jgi:predicted RNA-binding protein with PIN domain
MKLVYALIFLLLISCNSNVETTQTDNYDAKIDSILTQSQENITIASGASRKSDSTITGKVEKTVKKIKKMENEIKELKQENNELKNQLDDNDDDGKPYHISTISDY